MVAISYNDEQLPWLQMTTSIHNQIPQRLKGKVGLNLSLLSI